MSALNAVMDICDYKEKQLHLSTCLCVNVYFKVSNELLSATASAQKDSKLDVRGAVHHQSNGLIPNSRARRALK
eukprot:6212021-Pleurochrysis_carterae.AAC.2